MTSWRCWSCSRARANGWQARSRACPDDIAVVIHRSPAGLAAAQPYAPIIWGLTTPAQRRYMAGWFSARELHVLAPRVLAARASGVAGSREMAMLAPAALYGQLIVSLNNPGLAPPFRVTGFARWLRWAWLVAGAAQHFSGQGAYARPAIARRLREGHPPSFPPSVRDAALLGASVYELVELEEGIDAAVELALYPPRGSAADALRFAFPGRPPAETEAIWRAHLGRSAWIRG